MAANPFQSDFIKIGFIILKISVETFLRKISKNFKIFIKITFI